MTNSKDFLNKLENAYRESIDYSKWDKFNNLITAFIILFTIGYCIYINSFYVLLTLVIIEVSIAVFINFKLDSKERQIRRDKYVGQLSELFDLSHPVINENNEILIKNIKEEKCFSGALLFDIYCSIKEYEKVQESKFIINNTPYDKDYLNKLVEDNIKDLKAFSN